MFLLLLLNPINLTLYFQNRCLSLVNLLFELFRILFQGFHLVILVQELVIILFINSQVFKQFGWRRDAGSLPKITFMSFCTVFTLAIWGHRACRSLINIGVILVFNPVLAGLLTEIIFNIYCLICQISLLIVRRPATILPAMIARTLIKVWSVHTVVF